MIMKIQKEIYGMVIADVEAALSANMDFEPNEKDIMSVMAQYHCIVQKRIMQDIKRRIADITRPIVLEAIGKIYSEENIKANVELQRAVSERLVAEKVEQRIKEIERRAKELELKLKTEYAFGTVNRLRETIQIQQEELKRLGSKLAV